MRLDSLYINGFGLFHDIVIETISPGLTVFLGNNEAGKSTILGFIRAILFGFPDGRSNENPYPPLAGGRHGGSISFALDDGQLYVVERYPGTGGGKVDVIKPDQTHGGKEFLNRLLGTDNKSLFKNIYAFSLTELQNFETLNTDSVGEALYSAGAGIDPGNLANLKSSLDKEEGDLFKPGGKKPKINSILARLTALLKEKKGLQGSIEEYDRTRTQISHLANEISRLETKKLDLAVRLRRNEQRLNILPVWIDLSLAKQKLDDLAQVKSFPLQGIARLEGLDSRLADLQNELQKKEEELKRQESGLPVLKTDPEILNHSSSIRQLQKDQGHFDAVVRDLLTLNQELTSSGRRLQEGIGQLGRAWSEEKVLRFDLSIPTREEIRASRERLAKAALKKQRKKDSLEALNSRKREAEAILRDLHDPAVKDPEQLNRTKNACLELRSLESQEHLLKEELRHTAERLNDLGEEKKLLEEGMLRKTRGLPFWPIPTIMGAGILLLIWFGLRDEWGQGLPLTALFLFFALGLHLLRSRLRKLEQERSGMPKRRAYLLSSKIDVLETGMTDLKQRLDLIQDRMNTARRLLSLPELSSGESLDLMEQEISERITRLDRWKMADKNLELLEKRYREALAELRNAESEEEKIHNTWKEWLKDRTLDPVLSPDGMLETLTLIQSCREQAEALGQLRTRISSLEERRDQYLDLAYGLLETLDRRPEEDSEIQVAIHNLIQDSQDTEQAVQKKELLKKEMDVSRDSVERLKGQTKGLRKEIQELILSGGADDEGQFRERAGIYENRTALEKDIERYEDSIRRLSSRLGSPEEIIKGLSKADHEELEGQKIGQEIELKEVEEKLDWMKREQARLEEQSRHQVNDERLSALSAEEAGLREELSNLAEEWSTVRLARGLTRMARARYEKERQPEVISGAGSFFKHMTLGKYPSLVAPIGEDRVEVVCRDNSRKEIGQLSRGTAEQLYLSLRFGFIREFSRRSNPLPVIMDEILVNFDPRRAKATVKGIFELSREHQVLFFTCHPDTAALFKEADMGTPVLEIAGGEVRGWDIRK